MKKLLAVLCVMVFCGSASAMEFPELGVCQGDNVRLRERPGTQGRVIGRADMGTRFVILGETKAGGKTWYKIDNPTKAGNAYIAAEYVNGWYSLGKIATGKDFAEVRLTFGITPEKTRLLLGKPKDERAEDEFNDLTYAGCDLSYEEGYLNYVHVHKRGYAMAGIQVGDKAEKLERLGLPDEYGEGYTYRSASGEEIFFQFGPGRNGETIIESMTWSTPQAVG